ncbi:MAG: hypothetical protein ACI814_005268, partial [Mariniblastus sp.]
MLFLELADDGTYHEGDWVRFDTNLASATFALPAIDFNSLELSGETGVDANNLPTTADPIVVGSMTFVEEAIVVAIEVDHDGSDNQEWVHQTVTPDSEGNFAFQPTDLEIGSQQLKLRTNLTLEDGTVLRGQWQSFSFTLEEATPTSYSVETLELANDSGNV